MGFLKNVLSGGCRDIARNFDKYSRDSRLNDEQRSECRDKADAWRDLSDRIRPRDY